MFLLLQTLSEYWCSWFLHLNIFISHETPVYRLVFLLKCHEKWWRDIRIFSLVWSTGVITGPRQSLFVMSVSFCGTAKAIFACRKRRIKWSINSYSVYAKVCYSYSIICMCYSYYNLHVNVHVNNCIFGAVWPKLCWRVIKNTKTKTKGFRLFFSCFSFVVLNFPKESIPFKIIYVVKIKFFFQNATQGLKTTLKRNI